MKSRFLLQLLLPVLFGVSSLRSDSYQVRFRNRLRITRPQHRLRSNERAHRCFGGS